VTHFNVAVVGDDWRHQLLASYLGRKLAPRLIDRGFGVEEIDENLSGMWDSAEITSGWFPFRPDAHDCVDRSRLESYAYPGRPSERLLTAPRLDQARIADLDSRFLVEIIGTNGLIRGSTWLHPEGEHPGLRPMALFPEVPHLFDIDIANELRSLKPTDLLTGFDCHR